MTRHVSDEQVRHWLDDTVIREVSRHGESETEFNFELELSRLPIHVIKDEQWGPVRIVGRNGFEGEDAKALLRDDDRRSQLLQSIGPMLAATPGFYTFLDEEGAPAALRHASTLQLEARLYPEETTQQALMDAVMGIGSCMRYVRDVVVAMTPTESEE